MRISTVVMIVVLIGAMGIGISSFHGGIVNEYGGNTTDVSYLNASSGVSDRLEDMQDILVTTQATDPLTQAWTIATGSVNALLTSFDFIDVFSSMIVDTAELLMIPAWVTGMVLTLLGILIIAGVLYAFLKVKW